MKNCKTLNLVIVGLGNTDAVQDMLKFLRKCLAGFAANEEFCIYDNSTLDKAESKPELLRKKSSMSFRVSENFEKIYTGFAGTPDCDKLYDYLYASLPYCSVVDFSTPYYSRGQLAEIIQEHFDGEENDEQSTFGDISFRIECEALSDGKSYTKIEIQIAEIAIDDFLHYLEWFESLIKELDIKYADSFQSAYISFNYPQMAIVHKCVYKYSDKEVLDRYILGAEWYVYMSRNILNALGKEALCELMEFTTTFELSNGISYKANVDMYSFDSDWRRKVSRILKEILIPAYGIYDWQQLFWQSWSVSYMPKRIDVYCEPFGEKNIVLSYNYDMNKLNEERGLKTSQLMESFRVKSGVL